MEKLLEINGNIVNFLDSSGKDIEAHSMSASDISTIHIDNCTVSKLFKKIETKRIRINAQGVDKPLEIYANKVGDADFAEYEAALIEFAKKFHIAYRTPE